MTSEDKKCESGSCIQADIYYGEHLTEPVIRVHSTETDTVMQALITEWIKFVREVRLGDWDHIETDYEILIARDEQAKILNTIEIDANQPRLLSDVVGPEVAAQIEESLAHPETFVRRERPQRHDLNEVVDVAEHKAR